MTFDNDYYSLEDFAPELEREPIAQIDLLDPQELAEIEREGRDKLNCYDNNEDPPTEEEIDLDQYLFFCTGLLPH